MSLIKAPTAIALGGRKDERHYAINFQYEWLGDVPIPCNLGGYAFTGNVWTLDVLSTKSSSNFPAFKSLQFAETFAFISNAFDGALIIYNQSSGQLVKIGCPYNVESVGGVLGTAYLIKSGVLQVVGNAPTQIQFGKEVSSSSGILDGSLRGSLFSFDLPPYIDQGMTSSI